MMLILELENEVSFQSDGGTSYRKLTAELALEIAKNVNDFFTLLKRESAKKIVQSVSHGLDAERIEDVGEMLYTIAKEIHLQQEDEELQAYLKIKLQENHKES